MRPKRAVRAPGPEWPDPVMVKEWMTHPVTTIASGAPVRQAAELMRTQRIRHLPVMDGGRLVGIVTDRDLRQVFLDPVIHDRLADLAATLETHSRP
jgi:signal-transduction protein with cAMP-binding, CBS, and nucleotidyltransferase domain